MNMLKLRFVFIILVFQVVTATYSANSYGEDTIGKEDDNGEAYGYRSKYRKTNYQHSNRFDGKYKGSQGGSNNKTEEGSCNKCGKANDGPNSGFVINGRPVKPLKKYPWVVPLMKEEALHCGAALISATYVMTAGHCVFDMVKVLIEEKCKVHGPPKECYLQTHELKVGILVNESRVYELVDIKRIIGHPKSHLLNHMHDIALLQLASPVRCGATVMPICLPPKDFHKIGTKLITAGWGWYTPEGPVSDVLREGVVKEVDPRRCLKPVQPGSYHVNLVCAAGMESGQSSCHGDSGSALFGKFGSKFYAVGVASYLTTKECTAEDPVVYHRVYSYTKFIKYHVKDLPRG